MLAFQAGDEGLIPSTRSKKKTALIAVFFLERTSHQRPLLSRKPCEVVLIQKFDLTNQNPCKAEVGEYGLAATCWLPNKICGLIGLLPAVAIGVEVESRYQDSQSVQKKLGKQPWVAG